MRRDQRHYAACPGSAWVLRGKPMTRREVRKYLSIKGCKGSCAGEYAANIILRRRRNRIATDSRRKNR